MIYTLEPDSKGRVTMLKALHMVGWTSGQGIEVDLIKPVNLTKNKKPGGNR